MIFDAINVLVSARSATSTTAGLRSADPVVSVLCSRSFTDARDQYSLGNSVTNLLAPYSFLSLNIMTKRWSFWKHFLSRVGNVDLWRHCEKKWKSLKQLRRIFMKFLRWWPKWMSQCVHWILFNSMQVRWLLFQYFRRSLCSGQCIAWSHSQSINN